MDILDKITNCDDALCGECELDELRRSRKGEFVVCMGKLLNEALQLLRQIEKGKEYKLF